VVDERVHRQISRVLTSRPASVIHAGETALIALRKELPSETSA
jgi:hypothetical protein